MRIYDSVENRLEKGENEIEIATRFAMILGFMKSNDMLNEAGIRCEKSLNLKADFVLSDDILNDEGIDFLDGNYKKFSVLTGDELYDVLNGAEEE